MKTTPFAVAGVPRDSGDLEPNLGVALGSATIPNVEMAEGYATFASNGVHHDWYLIEQVSDPNGLRYEHKLKADRAFTPAVASHVTYAPKTGAPRSSSTTPRNVHGGTSSWSTKSGTP